MTKKLLSLATIATLGIGFSGCTFKYTPPNQAYGMQTKSSSKISDDLSEFQHMKFNNCNSGDSDQEYYCKLLNNYIDGTIKKSDKKVKTYISDDEVQKGITMMQGMGLSKARAEEAYKKDATGRYYTLKEGGISIPNGADLGMMGKNKLYSVFITYNITGNSQQDKEAKALKKYNQLISSFNKLFNPYLGKQWFKKESKVMSKKDLDSMNKKMDSMTSYQNKARSRMVELDGDTSKMDQNIATMNQFKSMANKTYNKGKKTSNPKTSKVFTLESQKINNRNLMYDIKMNDLKPINGIDMIQISVLLTVKTTF